MTIQRPRNAPMLTKKVLLPLIAVACLATMPIGIFTACQSSAPPAPPAPAQVEPQRPVGMNVNNQNEVAVTLAETPIFEWSKTAADPSATSTTAELPIGIVGPGPQPIAVGTCQFNPQLAETATGPFATITVYKRNQPDGGGGTTQTMIATTSTPTSISAFTPIGIATATNAYVSPGDAITVAISKTDAGIVVPAGQLNCFTTIR